MDYSLACKEISGGVRCDLIGSGRGGLDGLSMQLMDVGVVGSGAGGGCLAVVDGDGSSPSLIGACSEVELFSPFWKGGNARKYA